MKDLKKNSKYLLYGQALSFMGDYCVLPALLILSVYYNDYWVTSGVIIVRSIPMVLQPFLGVLIDKYSRTSIMFWTDIIRGIIFLLVIALPQGEYPLLFLFLLLLSYGSGVFFNPARLAVMSDLGDDIKKINTLFAKATTLSIIVGAILGGTFLILGSVKVAVAFNAITYFVSAIFIKKMKVQNKVAQTNDFKENLVLFKKGISEIKSNSYVLNAIFTMMTMATLWGVVYSYFPIISKSVGDGEIGNFILTVTIGVGGFIGALMITKFGFNSDKGLYFFSTVTLLSIGLYVFSSYFIVGLIAATGFFIAMEYGEVLAKVKVQENTVNLIQGRIFAVAEAIIGLFISIGSVLINFMSTNLIFILLTVLMAALFVHTKLINKLYHQKTMNNLEAYQGGAND
jgi:MFS transporter, DHA3 family, bacilysin exporter BacE